MAGEYRQPEVLAKLPKEWADPIRSGKMRIALTHTAIVGATIRKDFNEGLAAEYEKIGMVEIAWKLREGHATVILVPETGVDRMWRPGELYLTS